MKEKILLGLVIFLALFSRLYQLGLTPRGLYFDEASIGYNAYSILKTGRDEYGTGWPLLFRSYGDYKPGGYIYLTVLSEMVFGPTDQAVRFPSVLAGVAAVALVYFLVKQLSGRSKWALLAAWALAVSPWHIWFSRAGFESNLATTLVLGAVVAFLAGLKRHVYFLLVIMLVFAAMETYLSARILGPGVMAVLTILFWKQLRLKKSELGLMVALAFIFFYMTRSSFISPEATGHMNDQSIFILKGSPVGNLISNFVKNFSFKYLFFEGDDNPLRGAGIAVLYLWQLPFILAGGYQLVRRNFRVFVLVLAWLLLASLPAVLSKDSPQSIRGLSMVIPWQILTGLGLAFILRKKALAVAMTPIAILAVAGFWHSYFVHIPSLAGQYWGDTLKEAMEFVGNNPSKYQRLYVQEDIKYAYYLWYTRYDPELFQEAGGGYKAFGRFRNIGGYWRTDYRPELIRQAVYRPGEKNWLLVPGWLQEANSLPGKKIQTFYLENGDPGYYVYEL